MIGRGLVGRRSRCPAEIGAKRSAHVTTFTTQALQELSDQQVFVPPARRMQHLARAEHLLTEVQPDRAYPYQYVVFRVTEYRPDANADLMLSGTDLAHDLGLLIAELAGSLPAVPVEEMQEPVLTLDQISKKLNVTTKTINRWRKRGLIGIPVLVNGRRHVGFLPSLVDPFLSSNKSRVARSSQFSQLPGDEKERSEE